jgi:hypothetical protein
MTLRQLTSRLGLVDVCCPRWVDPGLGRHGRRHGCFAHEAFRFCLVCLRQHVLAGGMDGLSLAVVHLIRRHQSDADVMVILVIYPIAQGAWGFTGLRARSLIVRLALVPT